MKQFFVAFFFILPAVFLNAQQKDSISYGNNSKAGNYASIRGIKMYYEIYGTGQPLLIIHGNSGSIADFEAQIPYFSKKYKVIVADSRDHGNTLDTLHMDDSLSYEMMADDYAALLSHLKIDSAFVLGWSDGGINGILLAMRHPEKVKKLAITGANLWCDTSTVEPFIINYFNTMLNTLKKKPATTENKVMIRHFNLILTQPNIKPAALTAVKCPTLVMAGDHDVIRVQHTLLIAQSIPKSNLWIAPDAGHGLPVFGYKDKFNNEVDDFFQRPYKSIKGFAFFNN